MTVPDPTVTASDVAALDAPVDGPDEGLVDRPDHVPGGDADPGAAVEAPGDEPAYSVPPADSTDFRMALVSSVTVDLPNQHPAVCLREMETPRRQLTFHVGLQDGVALSHAMRRIPTPRPLTHEVMTDVLQRFDIDLVAVRIVGRVGSVHFAELDLRGRSGRSVHACRPTDALILALHQPVPAPILIDARLLESGDDVPPPGATT